MENKVELLDYMGSDKSHSVAAWASTFFELGIPMVTDPHARIDQIVDHIMSKSKRMRSVEDLLKYLADENHESPFRMSSFMFGTTEDIVTHYQKLKHRVILEAENGESAKYKELKEGKYYLPKDWDIPIKGFNIDREGIRYEDGDWTWRGLLNEHSRLSNDLYSEALRQLKPVLGDKRAKETARYFKTHNSQLNCVNKFSFAGVMTFYNKRTVDFAQEEIKDMAKQMVECIRTIPGDPFHYSLKAFGL